MNAVLARRLVMSVGAYLLVNTPVDLVDVWLKPPPLIGIPLGLVNGAAAFVCAMNVWHWSKVDA